MDANDIQAAVHGLLDAVKEYDDSMSDTQAGGDSARPPNGDDYNWLHRAIMTYLGDI